MSMRIYSNEGYGLNITEISNKTNFDRLNNFCSKDDETRKNFEGVLGDYIFELEDYDIEEDFEEDDFAIAKSRGCLGDFLEFANEWCNWEERIIEYSVVTYVKNKYNIPLFVTWDENESDYYVLYSASVPWTMTPEEKELTLDKLKEIFSDVVNALTGETLDELEYCYASYCG